MLLGSKDDGSGHRHAFEMLAGRLSAAARVVVVLYAPASQLELLPQCDRVAIMDDGKVALAT